MDIQKSDGPERTDFYPVAENISMAGYPSSYVWESMFFIASNHCCIILYVVNTRGLSLAM